MLIALVHIAKAGFFATLLMTWFGIWAEGIKLPRIDYAEWHRMKLAPQGASVEIGWLIGLASHFLMGITLAVIYAWYFMPVMPGTAGWLRGLIYGVIIWVASTIIYVPIVVKGGLFGARFGKTVWLGDLLARIVYGVVLGTAC